MRKCSLSLPLAFIHHTTRSSDYYVPCTVSNKPTNCGMSGYVLFFLALRFTHCQANHSVFYKIENGVLIIVAVYIDDTLALSYNHKAIDKLKQQFVHKYDMTDLSEAHSLDSGYGDYMQLWKVDDRALSTMLHYVNTWMLQHDQWPSCFDTHWCQCQTRNISWSWERHKRVPKCTWGLNVHYACHPPQHSLCSWHTQQACCHTWSRAHHCIKMWLLLLVWDIGYTSCLLRRCKRWFIRLCMSTLTGQPTLMIDDLLQDTSLSLPVLLVTIASLLFNLQPCYLWPLITFLFSRLPPILLECLPPKHSFFTYTLCMAMHNLTFSSQGLSLLLRDTISVPVFSQLFPILEPA